MLNRNLVPRVFSLSNMAAAGEKTLADSELKRSLIGAFHCAFIRALSLVYSFDFEGFVGLCIKVGRGQGDGDIGTRVWGLGDARRQGLEDVKYGTWGRGDVKYRDAGDAGCE